MSAGAQANRPSSAAFPGMLAGSWIESGETIAWNSAHMDAGIAGNNFTCYATGPIISGFQTSILTWNCDLLTDINFESFFKKEYF